MGVAILGGGIAGLSSAIALQQKGFEVAIYERHSKISEIGAGIVCWPNASFVLEQLGVLEAVRQRSGAINAMRRFSSKGESLGALDIGALNALMGYPSLSIVRHDLMLILLQRVSELGISIHYDHKVESIQTNDQGLAEVVFSHGARLNADIVIGADGRMNSIARHYVQQDNQPVFQKLINWIGVFESETALFDGTSVADYWGVGERFGIVPVSTHKAYWAGGARAAEIGERQPEQYQAELMAIFADWPAPIAQIIQDTPASRINKIYLHDHDPIQRWYKNNLILLGDAAHSPLPTSGQGACQALEDAWHLAECLAENSSPLATVFQQFTQKRQDKTSGITYGGRHLANSIFNSDFDACQQRNLASKNTDYQAQVIGMAKGWSSGLPLTAGPS